MNDSPNSMRITFTTYDDIAKINTLKASKHQRNKHPKDQIERLAKIMKSHGVRHPIHVSKLSGQVCFGHGRWEAAKLNKWTEYPIVYQEFKDDDEEYACVQSDNAIAHWAELDLSSINNDLQNLGPNFDIDLLGIKDFVLEPAEKFEAQCDEDAIPENADTRCKLGDVWQLGRHRLVCGDSTDVCAVDLLMAGEKADMAYCDPPYGADIVNKNGKPGGSKPFGNIGNMVGKAVKAGVYKPIIGDETTDTAKASYGLCSQMCHTQIFWGAQYYAEFLPPNSGWIVWDKQTDGSLGDGELAYTNVKKAVRIFAHKWSGMIKASEHGQKRVHPTQKPIALAEWCFDNYGEPQKIVDLFGGSGSTLIACEKTNRRCFMMELDPHYCDVILTRWEKYTGQLAERLDEGKEGRPEHTKADGPKAKANRRKSGQKPGGNKLLLRRNGSRAGLRRKDAKQ